MPLKFTNSTRLGSTITNWTSSGVVVHSKPAMIAFTQTDLPEPVAPAMSKCGILARSSQTGCPATSCPNATFIFDLMILEIFRFHHAAQTHDRNLRIRHFDADDTLAWDRRFDADRRGGEREFQIVLQRANAAHFDFDAMRFAVRRLFARQNPARRRTA